MSTPRYWKARQNLSPRAERSRVRRAVDVPFAWAVGSVAGARRPCPALALTFDDGPDPEVTARLLEALAAEGVHATFFFLLDGDGASPELVRRAVLEGHEVGLHGLDHRRLTSLEGRDVADHIRAGRDRLTALAGVGPRWFRPPFGAQDLRSYAAARRAGLDVVVWSVDAEDWVDDAAATIARRAVDRSAPGGILLLHELARPEQNSEPAAGTVDRSSAVTFDPVEVARLTIGGLRSRGIEPMSVGELTRIGGIRRTVWFRP